MRILSIRDFLIDQDVIRRTGMIGMKCMESKGINNDDDFDFVL